MTDPLIVLAIVGVVLIVIAYWVGKRQGSLMQNRQWELQVPEIRSDAIARSRSVLGGQFSEQLAPYLPNFPFSPTECRFLGKPIDFLVFRGMDKKQIDEIVFVEVKSGKSKLSEQEKNLKKAIQERRVSWHEYAVPSEVTKEKLDD